MTDGRVCPSIKECLDGKLIESGQSVGEARPPDRSAGSSVMSGTGLGPRAVTVA